MSPVSDMIGNFNKTKLLQNIENLNVQQLAQIFLETAAEHGFVADEVDIDQKLLLAVGELVEAQNELREGHGANEIYLSDKGKPEGFPIELADAVIRIFDLAAELGIDIQDAIKQKAIYNESRPYKHGKQF